MRGLAILICCVAAAAAAGDLTLEQALAKHVAALGGEDKLAAVSSLKQTGVYVYNGIEYGAVVYREAGSRVRVELDGYVRYGASKQPGKKEIRAFDGETAWVVSETESSEVKDLRGPGAAFLISDADLHGPLASAAQKGYELALVGKKDLEGAACYQIKATLGDGVVQHWWLDAETFLPVQTDVMVTLRDRTFVEYWRYDDYRETGGVMMPYYVSKEENLFTGTFIFEEIAVNPKLDGALFAKPQSQP